jgi:hypothetical protein
MIIINDANAASFSQSLVSIFFHLLVSLLHDASLLLWFFRYNFIWKIEVNVYLVFDVFVWFCPVFVFFGSETRKLKVFFFLNNTSSEYWIS